MKEENTEGLSKLERKRKKTAEKEQADLGEKAKSKMVPHAIETVKKIGFYVIAGTVIFGIFYAFYILAVSPYSGPQVHWHAAVDIEACGLHMDLPRVPPGADHLGNDLLHTHDDNRIHVEGVVKNDSQITLGAFFDAIGMPFSENQISTYKNGETCPGNTKSGKVKLLIDSKENNQFRDHVVKDGEAISIIFN